MEKLFESVAYIRCGRKRNPEGMRARKTLGNKQMQGMLGITLTKLQKRRALQKKHLTNANGRRIIAGTVLTTNETQIIRQRRKVSDLILFYKILHSKVNSSALVSTVCLNVPPRRTRHTNVFVSAKRRLLLSKNSYVPRCVSLTNLAKSVDFFDENFLRFKHLISDFYSLT